MDGRMEDWMDGRMEGWKDGRLEGRKTGRLGQSNHQTMNLNTKTNILC